MSESELGTGSDNRSGLSGGLGGDVRVSDTLKVTTFIGQILNDWDTAMDAFFRRVKSRAEKEGLSNDEIEKALYEGYGVEVSDNWAEWVEE